MKVSLRLLRETIRDMIVEGRIEDFQKKYPDLNVKQLASNDPSGKNKYLGWMTKQVAAGAPESDVAKAVVDFNQRSSQYPSKDINAYKTLDDLIAAGDKTRATRGEKKSDATKIFDDQFSTMYHIATKKACQIYGSNTKWCITMDQEGQFERYSMGGQRFYFIFPKKKLRPRTRFTKIALQVYADNRSTDIWDAQDHKLDPSEVEPIVPNISKIIDVAEADAKTRAIGKVPWERIKNEQLSPEERKRLVSLFIQQDDSKGIEMLLKFQAWNGDLEQDVEFQAIDALSSMKNGIEVIKSIATNTKSVDVLRHLAEKADNIDHDNRLKFNHLMFLVARNSKTPVDVLEQWAETVQDKTIIEAIGSSTIHDSVLQVLIQRFKRKPTILASIAWNIHASLDVLRYLATIKNKKVQDALSVNSHRFS